MRRLKTEIRVKAVAAIDAALFYLAFDLIFGVTITWPVVLAVAWCADTALGPDIRAKARIEALEDAADLLLGRGRRISRR